MLIEDVLPTLVLVAIVYGLYRWLTGPSDPFAGVKREMVDAVSSAFPQEPIANVVYSLTRTRSPQTTSEILLERGALPAPPPGFTVPDHLRPAAAVPISSSNSAPTAPAKPSKPTSLIERYGLGSRVNEDADTANAKWEATREGREADLKARKERMILEARRRMLAKQKSAGADAVKIE